MGKLTGSSHRDRGTGNGRALRSIRREGARAVITAVEDRSARKKEGEIVALGADGFGMLANVARRGESTTRTSVIANGDVSIFWSQPGFFAGLGKQFRRALG